MRPTVCAWQVWASVDHSINLCHQRVTSLDIQSFVVAILLLHHTFYKHKTTPEAFRESLVKFYLRIGVGVGNVQYLSLIHISEPTRLLSISYAVFCLKKKKKKKTQNNVTI
eukprot:TRINITY_DN14585_c0_g1_i12.p1 TRINITY_DN14585_c0_g1~~TRINITY_DN14585_c0_g1_i12.p1  ORF type:complete len:111 (+),score=12.95 TRINITY_DN14585_c0_g1_i12:453-785(+)